MVAVHVGTDTYGRVKQVGATAVVTKFVMAYAFPLVPRESYYYYGKGQTTTEGVPFFFTQQTSTFRGLPLARLDWLSVVMSYLRGLCAALMLVGLLAALMLFARGKGQQHDEFADGAVNVLLTSLVAGVGGGLLTYIPGIQTTARERAIRRECGEVLGMCIDPARVRDDVARELGQTLREQRRSMLAELKQAGISESPEVALRFQLLAARIKLALGEQDEALEVQTDELLERIEACRGRSPAASGGSERRVLSKTEGEPVSDFDDAIDWPRVRRPVGKTGRGGKSGKKRGTGAVPWRAIVLAVVGLAIISEAFRYGAILYRQGWRQALFRENRTAPADVKWEEFVHQSGLFRVEMPGAPRVMPAVHPPQVAHLAATESFGCLVRYEVIAPHVVARVSEGQLLEEGTQLLYPDFPAASMEPVEYAGYSAR